MTLLNLFSFDYQWHVLGIAMHFLPRDPRLAIQRFNFRIKRASRGKKEENSVTALKIEAQFRFSEKSFYWQKLNPESCLSGSGHNLKTPGNDELVQLTPEAHVQRSCSISSCQKVKLPGRGRINCIDQSNEEGRSSNNWFGYFPTRMPRISFRLASATIGICWQVNTKRKQ
jgi:hypothetical protein